ncbi:hypothetical protein [Leptolyngbya sp. 7M]|nr:hypothetical protein [Leptolyngbya sp. 7M]
MKRLILITLAMITVSMLIPSLTPSADALNKRFREAHERVMNR